ncbi:hypothetical protein MSC49_24460 [Methylosinus sp. C49]|nr:hypothetical protein MSC49_24460 [Methylosinus sp. C49]
MLFLPALADIRAGRLLADGGESAAAQDRAGLAPGRRARRLDPDPLRLARERRVRPMRFFGVADGGRFTLARVVVEKIEEDGHGFA